MTARRRRGGAGSVASVTLPADAHVHSEWSWDAGSDPASPGTMERTCARAVRIGLPAVIFTEHLDFEDRWRVDDGDMGEHAGRYVDGDGLVHLPRFEVESWLESIDRCRHAFPELRILTGVEFGQPHLWEREAAPLLDSGVIDRVNGSLHMLPLAGHQPGDRSEPITLYRNAPADEVMRAYLEEVPRMVAGSDRFEVMTHLDYAARAWPAETEGPFDPRRFEELFRAAMRALAGTGRALEMNTRRLWSWIPQWWVEEGGRAVSFGSDSHRAQDLANGLPEAAVMLEHFGFRPGRRPEDLWTR
jgi:histidinol-phosphatase (PHP family)